MTARSQWGAGFPCGLASPSPDGANASEQHAAALMYRRAQFCRGHRGLVSLKTGMGNFPVQEQLRPLEFVGQRRVRSDEDGCMWSVPRGSRRIQWGCADELSAPWAGRSVQTPKTRRHRKPFWLYRCGSHFDRTLKSNLNWIFWLN
jgi:hypothetical protein